MHGLLEFRHVTFDMIELAQHFFEHFSESHEHNLTYANDVTNMLIN